MKEIRGLNLALRGFVSKNFIDSEYYPMGLSGVSTGSFVFSAPKLMVGNGVAAKAVTDAMHFLGMKNPLIVTGSCGLDRLPEDLQNALTKMNLKTSSLAAETGIDSEYNFRDSTGNCVQINVKSEPTVKAVVSGTSVALVQNCDGVVSIGGGSAIDIGKAISAMVTNHGNIYDHLDAVGSPYTLQVPPLPFIAIPTVSGSGAEVKKKALLRCAEHDRTLVLQHERMAPKVSTYACIL